jgi:hypothetical protein
MTDTLAARRLRLITSEETAFGWFCGRCAERFDPPEDGSVPRVCPSCSLGMVLRAPEAAIPDVDTAFLIVDSSMNVQAVSERAEVMLGVTEERAVNQHVTELLIPGDVEPNTVGSLAGAITAAAAGDDAGQRVAVRPSRTFGLRMFALIAACGPPRSALIALN